MPPKADQNRQATPRQGTADKAGAALSLPGLPLTSNGRHSPANQQDNDHNGFDQDDNTADPLQTLGMLLNNDDEDADDAQEFENLVSSHMLAQSRISCCSSDCIMQVAPCLTGVAG